MNAGVESRKLAVQALERIDSHGAYANLALASLLEGSVLSDRDRGFVTELVYGTTRMQRALDFVVDPFLKNQVDGHVRAVLRMGAYQLHFMDTPPHAAVDATVSSAKKRVRGLINAVLRKVAHATPDYPNDAVRLSYPDWIVEHLVRDLGADSALAALQVMNQPATTHTRSDGYVQDTASQEVVQLVAAVHGEVVIDVCAAPGGKATGIAAGGAHVVAGDLHVRRAGLVARNARRLNAGVAPVVADARMFPVRPGSADVVLVDAPCSGLGSLRRRADARWRIDAAAPERLARLQTEMLHAAAALIKPSGRVVYSVCTLTEAETARVVAASNLTPASDPVRRLPTETSDGMWSQVLRRP